MTTTTLVRVMARGDTAANWTAADPVLLLCELGYEKDTGKLKFGDGSTAWNTLPYFSSAAAYTDEQAQDAVGTILIDSATIDFTYDDPGNTITADLKDGSVTLAKLAAGILDTDGTLAANSDTRIASQKAVKTFVAAAVTGVLKFKGSTDCSANPNYPAASKGDSYVVTVAGKIGGAAGAAVDAGDVYFATADNAGGTQAAVGASWDLLEHNLVGALLAANNLSDLTNAATARANLGLAIGVNVQAYAANLAAIAGLATAADQVVYWTGSGAAALASLTASGRSLCGLTIAQGDILYGSAAGTVSVLAKNATAQRVLTNGGGSNNPSWGQVDLTAGVTGTLPVLQGGTGVTTATGTGSVVRANGPTLTGALTGANATFTDAGQVFTANFSGSTANAFRLNATNASYTGASLMLMSATAAGATSFSLFSLYASGTSDLKFNVRGDGTVASDGGTTMSSPADYAEMFEWADGNPDHEDRVGLSVVLEGHMIRKAAAGDEPFGIVSGNPAVLADNAWNHWQDRHLRDDFNRPLWEDYEAVWWTETIAAEEGESETTVGHGYAVDAIPQGVVVPPDAERGTRQRRVVNPAYDPSQDYVPRQARPEWDAVGMMGKLRLRNGQPVAARWQKMREISAGVEEWLVR